MWSAWIVVGAFVWGLVAGPFTTPAWWEAYYRAEPFQARFIHPPEGCWRVKHRPGGWWRPAHATTTVMCWQESHLE